MKVGDLVRCVWQPRTSSYDHVRKCVLPMKYKIKGEIGLITKIDWRKELYYIVFPQFAGYTHELSYRAFVVLK